MEGMEGWCGGGKRWCGDVVMWCTGYRVLGPNPLAPGGADAAHNQQVFIPRSAAPGKGLGGGLRPSPSRQAHRPTSVSEGEGEWGRGGCRAGRARGRCTMWRDASAEVGVNGGGGAYLSCSPSRGRCRNIQNPGLEVGVEIRRPEAGAGTQSGTAKGIDFSDTGCSRCAMPTLLATLPPRFKHLPARSSCTLATVRYTCVQKGGGAMCAQQQARHTGVFDRPEAD